MLKSCHYGSLHGESRANKSAFYCLHDHFVTSNNIVCQKRKWREALSDGLSWTLRRLQWQTLHINSLRPKQNGRLFADDTFKCIFLNENIRISTKNSLKFVPKGLIHNIPALVLIMAWRRPGDKPLSEPMLVRSLPHIWVTRPRWVNWSSQCCQWVPYCGQGPNSVQRCHLTSIGNLIVEIRQS